MSSQEGIAQVPLGSGPWTRVGNESHHHVHSKHIVAGAAAAHGASERITDPKLLRVLVVDSKGSSRTAVCSLLRDCEYQVTSVKTSAEALHFLLTGQQPGSGEQSGGTVQPQHAQEAKQSIDLVIKEHEPPNADAGRLLKKMARSELSRKIPVVVMSSHDERDMVMHCLTLGAIDYLVKPLRHNELRHIWTRVWWWRRRGLGAPVPLLPSPRAVRAQGLNSYQSSESKATKCDDDEEPTSKEGSAPDANNGSNGNGHGSNGHGSKDGNGTSRVDAKPHDTNNGNGNGSSDNKNGHHGSNGNGASTTLAVERNGTHPLAHTAEGRAPQSLAPLETQVMGKVATGRSVLFANDVYAHTPIGSTTRKRPFNQIMEPGSSPPAHITGHLTASASEPNIKPSKGGAGHRERDRHERGGSVVGAAAAERERDRYEHEGRSDGGRATRMPSGGAGTCGQSTGPCSSRGIAAAGTNVGSHPTTKAHSQETQVPSQRAQLVSAFGASRGEGGASVSGHVVAHGSNGSRNLHGTTGNGSSGQDATITVSGAPFASRLSHHHVQPCFPTSVTHLPAWNSLGGSVASAQVPTSAGMPSAPFSGLCHPFGLPPHLLNPALLPMFGAPPNASAAAAADLQSLLVASNVMQAVHANPAHLLQRPASAAPLSLHECAQLSGAADGSTALAAAAAAAAAFGAEGCSSTVVSRGPARPASASSVDASAALAGPHGAMLQYLSQFGGAAAGPPPPSATTSHAAAAAAAAATAAALNTFMSQQTYSGANPATAQALAAWLAAGGNSGALLLPQSLPGGALAPHFPSTAPSQHAPSHHTSSAQSLPQSLQSLLPLGTTLPSGAGAAHSPMHRSKVGSGVAIGAGGGVVGPMPQVGTGGGGSSSNFLSSTSGPTLPSAGASAGPLDLGPRGARAYDPGAAMLLAGVLNPYTLGLPAAFHGLATAGTLAAAAAATMGARPPALGLASAAVPSPAGAGAQTGPTSAGAVGVPGVNGNAEPSSRRRRALALDKYRQKRKNLKFSTAIRYENRKAQAQARPRIKGQFAKAPPVETGSLAADAADGSNACDEQRGELCEDTGLRPAINTQDEDEEYDHGVDDDDMDNDRDDEDGPVHAVATAGAAGALLAHKRQTSSSHHIGGGGGGGGMPEDAVPLLPGKRWASRPHLRTRSAAGKCDKRGGAGGTGHDALLPRIRDADVEDEDNTFVEEEVADSLRQLKEGGRIIKTEPTLLHRLHRSGTRSGAGDLMTDIGNRDTAGASGMAANAGAGVGASGAVGVGSNRPGSGPVGPQTTSLSLGSQSGLGASKGSHGRTSQAGHVGARGDSAGGAADGPGGVGQCGPQRGGREGVSSRGHSSLVEQRTASNQNNCKNGSDSGSNSPDENGTCAGGDAPPTMIQRVASTNHASHGKSHSRQDSGGGGGGPGSGSR